MNLVAIDSIPDAQKSEFPCHRFSHPAMATVFEIFIANSDCQYAEQATHAAFQEIDRLELELSRFIENSDISRINNLAPGQTIRIGTDALACLLACNRLYLKTGGAFDITVGALVDCWRNVGKSQSAPSDEQIEQAQQRTGLHHLELNEVEHTVKLAHEQPVAIDLGGFGKGYAVDKIAELLWEWSIEDALIHGGRSSIFAMGNPDGKTGWPVRLSHPYQPTRMLASINLHNRALSGSGLQKGQHIIDPRTGQPQKGQYAAWASAPDAATSDALSTAFMIMSPEEVDAFCSDHSDVQAMLFSDEKDRTLRFGRWDSDG